MSADDLSNMTCGTWREAISAIADGEEPPLESALLDAHLRRCTGCREFRSSVESLRQGARVGVAVEMPDLAPTIVKANAVADRRASWGLVRLILAAAAGWILISSLPALVLGEEAHTAAHEARHLGAFTAAYAIGLLVVAIRPARARTILPVAGFVALALVITSIVDLVNGHVPLAGEILHLPEVVGVVLVWLLAVPVGRRRDRAERPPAGRPRLTVVGPSERKAV